MNKRRFPGPPAAANVGEGRQAQALGGEEPLASSPLRRNSGGCAEKGATAHRARGPSALHTRTVPPPAAVGRASPLPRPGSRAGAHPPDPRCGPPGSSPHQARGLGPRALLLPLLFVLHPPPPRRQRWWLHAGPPGGAGWGGGGAGLGWRRQRRGARGGGACEDSGAAGEGGRTGTGWSETRREGGGGGGAAAPRARAASVAHGGSGSPAMAKECGGSA